jgi:excisionase family DNA binding protein
MNTTEQPELPSERLLECEKLGFSVAALCAITGLGRTTLFAAIKDGRLIARKAGRRTLVLRADLEEFLANLPKV